MRIVLIEFSPSGGLFQFAVQLGSGLARRGHAVRLLTGPDPELASRTPGFEIVPRLATWHPQTPGDRTPPVLRKLRRGVRAGQLGVAWAQVWATLRRWNPDVVLFSTWRFPLDAWAVTIVRRILPRATLGLVAHEPRPLREQSPGEFYKDDPTLTSALRKAWACLDVVFALGESARAVIEETWRPRAPITVIPHGDEGVFARREPTSAEATDPTILCFGTMTTYKGIDVLLDAFDRVRAQRPDARLVLAGAVGNDLEAGLLPRAKATPGVRVRPGYVPADEVQDLLESARAVALPYRRASQSGVAHLAQTFRRPVVATRVGDIPAAVRDGVDGWLVPPGDAPALAEALLAALADPAEAARRGDAGHARLVGSSWDEIGDRVSASLAAALAGSPR